MDNTVYIVQSPPPMRRNGRTVQKDLSSAQRYGKLMPILSIDDQASMTPGPCLQQLARELRPFDPAVDYLCYAGGDPMSLALALTALEYNGIREFNFLRWDRERTPGGQRTAGGFYVPVSVNLQI